MPKPRRTPLSTGRYAVGYIPPAQRRARWQRATIVLATIVVVALVEVLMTIALHGWWRGH